MTISRLLPALLLTLLLPSCNRTEEASSTSSLQTRSYQLNYLQPRETLRALQSLDFDPSVIIRADPKSQRIIATFPDPETGKTIEQLLEQIDVPNVSIPSRFVALQFADAGTAADSVSRKLPARDPGFEIVPDTRTNRVFLTGTTEQIDRATTMLEALDVPESP